MILFYTMLLTTTIYLGLSRATITDRLRPKIPLPIAKFTACSMCSGAWLGAAVAAAAWAFGYTYPGVSEPWHAIVVCFAGSALWTPLLAALVMFAIWYLGTPTDLVARLEEEEEAIEAAERAVNTPPLHCTACGHSWEAHSQPECEGFLSGGRRCGCTITPTTAPPLPNIAVQTLQGPPILHTGTLLNPDAAPFGHHLLNNTRVALIQQIGPQVTATTNALKRIGLDLEGQPSPPPEEDPR